MAALQGKYFFLEGWRKSWNYRIPTCWSWSQCKSRTCRVALKDATQQGQQRLLALLCSSTEEACRAVPRCGSAPASLTPMWLPMPAHSQSRLWEPSLRNLKDSTLVSWCPRSPERMPTAGFQDQVLKHIDYLGCRHGYTSTGRRSYGAWHSETRQETKGFL